MGQKVNPHGLRVGVIKDWDSRWYAKDEKFGDLLVSDFQLRSYLKKKLEKVGVPKIEIERSADRIKVLIYCAKPGIVIGKGGSEIDKLRSDIEKFLKLPANSPVKVAVNVSEVKNPDLNSQLVAENIAGQLERRISFRRAMKLSIGRTMKLGARGIKVTCSGRLGGAEIARSETYHEGTIPLQTIRADIDYGFAEANTTYGKIGVKVWIYRGEVLQNASRANTGRRERRDNRDSRPARRDKNRRGQNPQREGGRTNVKSKES